MFFRLRHDPFISGYDEYKAVAPAVAAENIADELFAAGKIENGRPLAITRTGEDILGTARQTRRRLLPDRRGICSCQSFNQFRLAVSVMTGRSYFIKMLRLALHFLSTANIGRKG